MKHYDLELTVVFEDHGLRQALGLQHKRGRDKSKILKWYNGDSGELIDTDGSVAAAAFTSDKKVRLNVIIHGDENSEYVTDGTERIGRDWDPEPFAEQLIAVVRKALPNFAANKFKRVSLIICYGGGRGRPTDHDLKVHPKDSFAYKFFVAAKSWTQDVTARTDVSIVETRTVSGNSTSLDPIHQLPGAKKLVGDDLAHHDNTRKVRISEVKGGVVAEWPYLRPDE